MTIAINTERLRDERRNRAWTQQHLAEVSDLGLRTIQRIERTGSASPESLQAIASCFELNVSDLIIDPSYCPQPPQTKSRFQNAITIAALVMVTLVSISATRFASAKDVTLSFNAVVTAEDDQYKHIGEMKLHDGEETQFQMNGVFKILVMPSLIGESQIMISLKIFVVNNGVYELASEPSLITASGKEAVFSLGLNDDRQSRVRVAVTPTF